jgi:hypothetical protein
MPRLRRRSASLAKKSSTALIHDADLGVKPEGPPRVARRRDALHRTDADADVASHRGRGPVRGLARCRGLRRRDDAGFHFRSELRDAKRAGLVAQQTGDASSYHPVLPTPDRGLAGVGAARNLHRVANVAG